MASEATLRLEHVEGSSLRFEADLGKGVRFHMDSGPAVTDPSPVQALLATLGGCSGMDVIGVLRKQRQRVTAYEVRLRGERRAEHPRAYTRIEVVHVVRGHEIDPRAVEEAIRLSDTKYCSVHASLSPAVEIVSRYEIHPA